MQKINIGLECKLYVHDPNYNIEIYGVLRKQKNLTQQDQINLEQIQYHVYDMIDSTKTFQERSDILKNIFTNNKFEKIKYVKTIKCTNKQEIEQYHTEFVQDNYEGSMIRNTKGLYKCKYRSYDLLKKKDFDDAEFVIKNITYELDSKTSDKLVVWTCITDENQEFNVRPKGIESERKMLYREGHKYIGSKLWVKYFGLTENGIPRFPSTKTESYSSYIRNSVE